MGKVYLDKRYYLQFVYSGASYVELIDTNVGIKYPAGHKSDGKQKEPATLGYFSSVLAALKFFAMIKFSKSKDMELQKAIEIITKVFSEFNDVSWLELAMEAKNESKTDIRHIGKKENRI